MFVTHQVMCVTRKQILRSLSLSYQKARPSFFWYDTNFSEFDSANLIDYILEKSVSYQKNDTDFSFGMRTTKTLRSVFS